MEGFYLYKKELEVCQLERLYFPSLPIHAGKKMRELETFEVLLSPTIVPLESPPPGDCSSRRTLP